MSGGALLYVAAMLAVFVAQRLLDGLDPWQAVVTIIGVAGLGVAIGLRLRAVVAQREPGLREGHRLALFALVTAVFSLLLYGLTTEPVTTALELTDAAQTRWNGSWGALWPILASVSTTVLLVLDRALQRTPVMIPVSRIRQAAAHALIAAMGVALMFPLNYAASRHYKQWDLRYFKTTAAGSSTIALVEALDTPITVRVFVPTSSDLVAELQGYFEPIAGDRLRVEYLDYAAQPRLSQALSVRENGIIAFTAGELDLDANDQPDQSAAPAKEDPAGPKPVTRKIRLGGDELDKAKRKLKQLDEQVQKILRELGQGERVAYFTHGHGELGWTGTAAPSGKARGLKQILEFLGFRVRQLKASGGLADEVPDDADLLVVLGPQSAFLSSEAAALRRFVDRGKAVLVALEPVSQRGTTPVAGADPLQDTLASLGVALAPGVLADERYIVPRARDINDRLNIVTDRYATHDSTATLGKRGGAFVLPGAGHLETPAVDDANVTVTVRSLPTNWVDLDHDLKFSAEAGEKKQSYNLAVAATGGEESQAWRAVVVADATALSDEIIGNPANQQFVVDSVNWLIGAEATTGRVESEEDVRIEHTRQEQALWFYAMVLGVPALVVGGGALHVRRRRRAGGKQA
ncbi:MAG: hypothetical protein B7733_14675 [Myxococcales bacterium FL481]|nr:MAG: hypothetical protein B7733_14675 [Myxococcales bacterium FL481]